MGGGGADKSKLRSPSHQACEISELNPYFCELTAIYWAWKNVEADYYGLFHYRRIFDLTPQNAISKLLSKLTPHQKIIKKYSLHSTNITQILARGEYDMIIPKRLKLAPHLNFYETYRLDHHVHDLDVALNYIQKHYPHMQDAIDKALFHKGAEVFYWNMSIWRKELYFEYCEWLFDVLFGIMARIDYRAYDSFQARVFGFLAERLSNVWLIYKIQTSSLKIKECKVKILYEHNKKLFGKVISREYERYYIGYIRVYKRKIQS